ncbi:hypothetical protein [Hydrogenophaga atypica]|uniref:Uncharacterized protein n=1 Tax=Hydrogenophaga atypica TaxID=249409 RepID=A0ABW2QPU1_9BURK
MKWNSLLLSEFFSPASAQEEVWLHTTRDELDSFGIHLGGAAGLVEAVSAGAPWLPSGIETCAEAALLLASQRKDRFLAASVYIDPGTSNVDYVDARAPTYLPILALWVLASSEGQGKGFYAEVESLLGKGSRFPNTGVVTNAMSHAWQDLEAWSIRECSGRFGIFRRRVLGAHCYVGLPRSQCLISRTDEHNLKRLFAELHLRPGEKLTPQLLVRLLADGRDAQFLSIALRIAMGDKSYEDPLHTQLQRLLDSWDGLKPRYTHATGTSNQAKGVEVGPSEGELVTLVLSESDDVENGWDVRWRIQAPTDNRFCIMRLVGQSVPARFHAAESTFVTAPAELHRKSCNDALVLAATAAVEVVVAFDDESGGSMEEVRRSFHIPCSARRTLCWNTVDPQYGDYLVERDIPLFGPSYVLCSPGVEASTRRWMQAEGIDFQTVPSSGLPDSWWLACIPLSERLSASQRQYLSDAADPANVPAARIRLVGGRPLLRGGARIFAAYDLPFVDIEAPDNSRIEAPGLALEEVLPKEGGESKALTKRFVIKHLADLRGAFDIKVLVGSHPLAEARLRIAYGDGEGRGQTKSYSIGNLGQSRSDEEGLRGTTIGLNVLDARREVGGYPETANFDDVLTQSIEDAGTAKFLNSLGRLGTIAYGAARDELRRQCVDADPMPLLMDLRARGFLEIQTDAKGHVVRVHSVEPSLYELPTLFSGLAVAGVAGTLTLPQWARLRACNELLVSAEGQGRGFLPVVRVAAESLDKIRQASKAIGFQFSTAPAISIATWSGSVEDARRTFARDSWEHFATKLSNLHRMKWHSAQFSSAVSEQMTIDREIGAQLFRFDDPQAWPLQLYVLGTRDQAGNSRYSHIHDSRWGTWISVLAFARLMCEKYERRDALPWPFPYDPKTRDLWLPARMRPPSVLERTLCLCSGFGAEVHFLRTGEAINDRLPMLSQNVRVIGFVSLVYEGFFPAHWLRFRDVPVEVASIVASRLGGELDSITSIAGSKLQPTTTA